jgi:hypothetical protein
VGCNIIYQKSKRKREGLSRVDYRLVPKWVVPCRTYRKCREKEKMPLLPRGRGWEVLHVFQYKGSPKGRVISPPSGIKIPKKGRIAHI